MEPSPPALGARSLALDCQAHPEPELLTSALPSGQSVMSRAGGHKLGWRGASAPHAGPPSLRQVPVQTLRDADGPAVPPQCRVCPAAAAALHGHGGAPERRALLGEWQGGVGAMGPPCLGAAEELGVGGSRRWWNLSFSSQPGGTVEVAHLGVPNWWSVRPPYRRPSLGPGRCNKLPGDLGIGPVLIQGRDLLS